MSKIHFETKNNWQPGEISHEKEAKHNNITYSECETKYKYVAHTLH